MLAEILYTIYTEDDDKSEKILDFFDNNSYYNSGISNCHSDWADEGVVVRATVSEDWNEAKAARALETLMKAHHLEWNEVEAEFSL